MTGTGELTDAEAVAVMAKFGVGIDQVERDLLISHVLHIVSTVAHDDVVFFGGTALSRTFLPDHRLSEDIDLICLGDRRQVGQRIEDAIRRAFERLFGDVVVAPPLSQLTRSGAAVLTVPRFWPIQIQLLSGTGYPDWPTEIVDIEQRYSDAPPATLRVLTPAAFAAAKLSAWNDRAAPRDLYDMWGLARAGMIDDDAAQLFSRFGRYTSAAAVSFTRIPTSQEWDSTLGHQCIPAVGPVEAADLVREAWSRY